MEREEVKHVTQRLLRVDVSGLMALMRPAFFTLTKKGDLEQTMQEFAKYVKIFGKFLRTKMAGNHTENHADCGACKKPRHRLSYLVARRS